MELLVQTRIEVLRAANLLQDDADITKIERNTRGNYAQALLRGTHTAYLVFDRERFAGAGGISYFRVMPTCSNPDRQKAYIVNMYTHTDYRRMGVASETLKRLLEDAKTRGVASVLLEPTEMGRPLYEKFGFVPMNGEMELPMGEQAHETD